MTTKYLLLGLTFAGLIACDSSKEVTNNTSNQEKSVSASSGKETIDVSYLDNSIRPQDDFFMYANGNWIKNNPIPASESRWGSFNELEKQNNEKLLGILESASKSDSSAGTDNQLLGDYYYSLMDMETRNDVSSNPIIKYLEEINDIVSKKEFPAKIAQLHFKGIPSFFSFGVGQDMKDVDNHISYISQGGLGLPNKDYYINKDKEKIFQSYIKYIHSSLELIDPSNAKSLEIAEKVARFEKMMTDSMMSPAELRIPEKTYNKMSKKEFRELTNGFDWEVYFGELGSLTFDSIVVGQPGYFKHITKLIEKYDIETLKYYMKWKVINHYSSHLSDDFVKLNFQFYGETLSGKKEMKPLNERAIDEITENPLGDVLGKVFVGKYYSANAQTKVNKLVDNLLDVFRSRIDDLSWMSDDTKKEALKKLNSIGRKLGFPEKWEDLSSVKLSKEDYIGNIEMLAVYATKKNLSELNEPVDRSEWGMPAHMVNAYYHPLLNEIAFPAGIMQPPFFSEKYEDAVNYGRIGMVIGHEFTHGFDDMGSKFAADGSFSNWWSDEDRKMFEERTDILGGTFSSFCTPDGQCVNPDLTMGENIADLGGLTLAYYAYTKTSEFKSGKKVNGFTPAQRFFLAYAQLWKINYTEEELKKRLATDPHSPGMYRVNGPLKNCPEFFEAFDVKEGDPMRNPEPKVARIW